MNRCQYFNSIKVRLEQDFGLKHQTSFENFNSIKVRLEPIKGKLSAKSTVEFQFHKGAIRTGDDEDDKSDK